jgi:hypothetical protein
VAIIKRELHQIQENNDKKETETLLLILIICRSKYLFAFHFLSACFCCLFEKKIISDRRKI